MMKFFIAFAPMYLFIILTLFCCSNREPISQESNTVNISKNPESNSLSENFNSTVWELDSIRGKTLVFKNNKIIETNLFELKYIGQLKTKNKIPYFILSGRTCANCDENISIYIWSPSDGPMKPEREQNRYSYPSKEHDYLSNELVYENRMFYGDCLGSEGCIWVQRTLNKNKTWDNSIFIIEIKNDGIQETRIIEKDNRIKEILNKIPKCKELKGKVITSEP